MGYTNAANVTATADEISGFIKSLKRMDLPSGVRSEIAVKEIIITVK